MSKTVELLDRFKKERGLTSDNAAALSLGVTRSSTSYWRLGKSHPDAVSVEKMAESIGENTAKWLIQIEAERAHTIAARRVWLRCAKDAAKLGMIALAFALPSHGHSAQVKNDDSAGHSKFYISAEPIRHSRT